MHARPLSLALLAAALALSGCAGIHTHVPVASTPAAVVAGFHREFPGLTIAHADTVLTTAGVTDYELKFRDDLGHYHRKMFTADGQLIDTKDNVALPPAAAAK